MIFIYFSPRVCVKRRTRRLRWLLLLLSCVIVQRVPCNCDHFLIHCAPRLSSNHFRFIHQISLLWLQQRHPVSKRGETGREMAAEFCLSVSLSYLKGSLICRKIRRKSCYGFLSPLKIHRSRPSKNHWTLDLMASMITITLSRRNRLQ
jgi:hypothetical protein